MDWVDNIDPSNTYCLALKNLDYCLNMKQLNELKIKYLRYAGKELKDMNLKYP